MSTLYGSDRGAGGGGRGPGDQAERIPGRVGAAGDDIVQASDRRPPLPPGGQYAARGGGSHRRPVVPAPLRRPRSRPSTREQGCQGSLVVQAAEGGSRG